LRSSKPARARQGGQGETWPPARRDLPWRLRLWIASTPPALNRAVARVRSLARRCGCDPDQEANLEIALREALANAMRHGNALLPGRRVFLRCYGGPEAGIVVAVRDEGPGFDPAEVPDPRSDDRVQLPHGRGLLLMRELMDRLEFRRGGSEVVLYSRLERP
jgi:serine/threonine-protein kinase RsbW